MFKIKHTDIYVCCLCRGTHTLQYNCECLLTNDNSKYYDNGKDQWQKYI
jgi:hypothetical protein